MLISTSSILYDEQFNCRGVVRYDDVVDLSALIDKQGLISPLTVRPLNKGPHIYHLIAGHRRYLAVTRHLNWTEVECQIIECSDHDAHLINLTENLGRRSLTPGQELKAIIAAYGDTPNVREAAEGIGKSKHWVQRRLNIRKLENSVQRMFTDGRLSAFDLDILIKCPIDEQRVLVEELIRAKLLGGGTSSVATRRGSLRRPRSRTDIQGMITQLMDEDVEVTAWRALAWAAGTLSDEELKSGE